MKANLYQEFNCKSREELYEKIKSQEEEIKPLTDFLDYVRADIKNKNQSINGPDVLIDYVKSVTLPSKDTGIIIFTDTKHHPVHLKKTRLSWKNSMQETLREGLLAGASRAFLAFSVETPSERMEATEEYFEKIGMKIIDTVGYKKENNSFISKKAKRSYYANKTYEIANDSEDHYEEKDYSLKDKYEDFSSYFANNELIDLDVVKNAEKVKEVLKIGFQHHQQEVFGILIYDSNEKIIGAEELFKGSTDATIVDLKILAKSLFQYKDVKGLAVFHNHPSGNPTPSREDVAMTERVADMADIFELEFLDHYIVGKERTLSFSQEVSNFQSQNLRYQEKQGQVENVSENKGIYNSKKEPLQIGDKIKTALSDETIVLKLDGDKAILFDGRQFIEANGLQSDNEKYFWNQGNYFDGYPQGHNKGLEDNIDYIMNKDYEGFVKTLIGIEKGIEDPDLLDEVYDRFMNNDGANLINDYFDEVIYDLENENTLGEGKLMEPVEDVNKDNASIIEGKIDKITSVKDNKKESVLGKLKANKKETSKRKESKSKEASL